MKKWLVRYLKRKILLVCFICLPLVSFLPNQATATASPQTVIHQALEQSEQQHHISEETESHTTPAGWAVIPFVLLLVMIATGPLFYEHFWHKNYPKISVLLGAIVVIYYVLALNNHHSPVHSFFEYVQFIALLTGLFVASGGIIIGIDKKATPMTNVILLLIGAVIANVLGTTGASMLMIRPYLRLNKHRIRAYHVVFFIFLVSNIGGSLTPIGDPPLFLGFLKGVPFEWSIIHNLPEWSFALVFLLALFYFYDKRNKKIIGEQEPVQNKITLKGGINFLWLAVVVAAVFLDPNVFDWVPAIHFDGQKFSFIREIIMLAVAYLSFRWGDKSLLKENDFSFEPIREVAFIFIGIFATMMPALELVGNFASSPEGEALINHNTLFWGTGMLSGVLDNAPTYLNFLAAAMASVNTDINTIESVRQFAANQLQDSGLMLNAISISAVFFGAITYIGNGPNFMVKSISEQLGIKMPSFFGYIIRFSFPILIPLFFLVWLIFFYLPN